jgi:hypothetical protein
MVISNVAEMVTKSLLYTRSECYHYPKPLSKCVHVQSEIMEVVFNKEPVTYL